MALIKSANAEPFAHQAVVLDLGDLNRQAEVMKQRARADADAIRAAAHEDVERLRVDASREGHAEGLAQGQREGLEQGLRDGEARAYAEFAQTLEALQTQWGQALETLESDRRALVRDAQEGLMSLALAMAERVVARVPRVDPTAVVEQVREAVDRVIGSGKLALEVHPEDRAVLEKALPELLGSLEAAEHVDLVDDAEIGRGGCRVRRGVCRVDATLETRLERLAEAMLPGGNAPGADREIDLENETEGGPS